MLSLSVVTLVNKPDMYSRCVLSTLSSADSAIDFVMVPNPESATKGLNRGLSMAKNDVVVFCHQDVLFYPNWRFQFEDQLKLVPANFGVLGTYGVRYDRRDGAGRVRSGNKELYGGPLPCMASYLDEHCLIIRRDSGLRFDETLTGFHMYGADLCLQAITAGLPCYAIDAKVHHLSDNLGNDPALDSAVLWFRTKWRGKAPFTSYRTTCKGRIRL